MVFFSYLECQMWIMCLPDIGEVGFHARTWVFSTSGGANQMETHGAKGKFRKCDISWMETTRCDNGHLRQRWQLMKWDLQELLLVTHLDLFHSSFASVAHALCDSETSRTRSSLRSSHTCRAEPWSARSAERSVSSSLPYTAFPRSRSAPESGSTGSLPSAVLPTFITTN